MNAINALVSILFFPAVIVRSGVGRHGLDDKMSTGDRVFTFVPLGFCIAFYVYCSVMLVEMAAYNSFFDIREPAPWLVGALGAVGLLIRWWVISDETCVKLVAARKAVNETMIFGVLAVILAVGVALSHESCKKVGLIMAGIGLVLVLQTVVAKIFLSQLYLPSELTLMDAKDRRRRVVKPTTPLLRAKARVKAARRKQRANGQAR